MELHFRARANPRFGAESRTNKEYAPNWFAIDQLPFRSQQIEPLPLVLFKLAVIQGLNFHVKGGIRTIGK